MQITWSFAPPTPNALSGRFVTRMVRQVWRVIRDLAHTSRRLHCISTSILQPAGKLLIPMVPLADATRELIAPGRPLP